MEELFRQHINDQHNQFLYLMNIQNNIVDEAKNVEDVARRFEFTDYNYHPKVPFLLRHNEINMYEGDSHTYTADIEPNKYITRMILRIELDSVSVDDNADYMVRYCAAPAEQIIGQIIVTNNNQHFMMGATIYNYFYGGRERPHTYSGEFYTYENALENKSVCYGYQTFKRNHDKMILFIPMVCWFSDECPMITKDADIKAHLDTRNLLAFSSAQRNVAAPKPTILSVSVVVTDKMYQKNMVRLLKNMFHVPTVFKSCIRMMNNRAGSITIDNKHIKAIHCSFRPHENDMYSQRWNSNAIIMPHKYATPAFTNEHDIMDSFYTIFEERPVIDKLYIRIDGITTLHSIFDAAWYSDPSAPGWYTLTAKDLCGSPVFPLASNSVLYIDYTSKYINEEHPATMQIIIEQYDVFTNAGIKLRYYD